MVFFFFTTCNVGQQQGTLENRASRLSQDIVNKLLIYVLCKIPEEQKFDL